MRNVIFLVAIALLIASCSGSGNGQRAVVSADSLYSNSLSALADTANVSDTIIIKYAKGLRVSYEDDSVLIEVNSPQSTSSNTAVQLRLSTKEIGARRFVCTTALQLGNFEVLGLEDRIVAVNSLRSIFSPQVREQVADGRTVRIGKEGQFDLEAVIASRPDYIFVSASKHGGFDALKGCGIPLIPHHGYKETDPLGQAEWIKLIGLLCGEPRRANAVFADIEGKYLALKGEIAALQAPRPTVMSGRQLRDGWYIVGGQSYMAQLFRDAGADYVMGDNTESGGVTLDYEAAYARAAMADFWQIDSPYDGEFTLDALAEEDARYAELPAFKGGKVLHCNLSAVPYRELSPVQPHLLLADFAKAFHPEVLEHYEPTYYRLLKGK